MADETPDLAAAADDYGQAAAVPGAEPLLRATCAYEAGRIRAHLGQWSAAATMYDQALTLIDTADHDRPERLASLTGLGPAATEAALQNRATPLSALIQSERGRSLLLTRLRREREDIARLRRTDPELAQRLTELDRTLTRPRPDEALPPDGAKRMSLRRQRDTLLTRIRELPDLAGFRQPRLPPTFSAVEPTRSRRWW